MRNTGVFEGIDSDVVAYFNRLIDHGRHHINAYSITIIGRTHAGQVLPNLYSSSWNIITDSERIARIFNGNVIIYYVKEDKVYLSPSISVGDFVERRLLEKAIDKKLLKSDSELS